MFSFLAWSAYIYVWRTREQAAEQSEVVRESLTDRQMWQKQACSCAVDQNLSALLALYIWSSTCSRLCTMLNCHSAQPPALHQGNIKVEINLERECGFAEAPVASQSVCMAMPIVREVPPQGCAMWSETKAAASGGQQCGARLWIDNCRTRLRLKWYSGMKENVTGIGSCRSPWPWVGEVNTDDG